MFNGKLRVASWNVINRVLHVSVQ
eukprot:COSAG01_NODE_30598_length_613_cov_0.850195_2_plen_23_part_01